MKEKVPSNSAELPGKKNDLYSQIEVLYQLTLDDGLRYFQKLVEKNPNSPLISLPNILGQKAVMVVDRDMAIKILNGKGVLRSTQAKPASVPFGRQSLFVTGAPEEGKAASESRQACSFQKKSPDRDEPSS